MPYVDTEYSVVVAGSLPAGEVWANRWTVAKTDPGATVSDANGAFRNFYNAWKAFAHEDWAANSVVFRNLATGVPENPSWPAIIGEQDGVSPLPTECALRISLSAAPSRHGGPFLAGVAAPLLDNAGSFNSADATTVAGKVHDLFTDLIAADWELRLDSPSDTQTREITGARLGRVFDVIRRRRNAIPESFITIATT